MSELKKKRTPRLVVDEVLLLVDTYFQLKQIYDLDEKKKLVKELSHNLRSLPFYPGWVGNPEFRSYSGMQMCLAKVGYVDPENTSKFGHGSILQRRIFERYVNCQHELHSLAKAIMSVAKEKFPIDYFFENSIFGMLVPSYHLFLERNNNNVIAVKRELQLHNQTCCKICGQDLAKIYGNADLIELHIDVPLNKNISGIIVSPSDLICICPTCHNLHIRIFITLRCSI